MRWTTAIAQLLAAATAGIGLMALLGYAAGIEQFYNWQWSAVPMAVNTALCFAMVGVSMFLHYLDAKKSGEIQPLVDTQVAGGSVLHKLMPGDLVAIVVVLCCTLILVVPTASDVKFGAVGCMVGVTTYYFGRATGNGNGKHKEEAKKE